MNVGLILGAASPKRQSYNKIIPDTILKLGVVGNTYNSATRPCENQ